MSALLDLTPIRNHYVETYAQLKHQSTWIIELARLFEPCDKHGQPRTTRQVKREVKQFLEQLEQKAIASPDEAQVIATILKAVHHRWWGLFTCYQVSNVPSSNNDLETFFKDMKHHQRRITGRKSVHEFILRYGPFAAFIDYAESFDDLLTRLRQVKTEDFKEARQVLQKVQLRLKKLYRFRIETFFSDQKSRGFHIHKSHLSDPVRLSRMLIAACLVYTWMICQGLQVMASNCTALIDRNERIDKSLFRLGLDWLKYALKQRLDFQPLFQFQPLEALVHVRYRIQCYISS